MSATQIPRSSAASGNAGIKYSVGLFTATQRRATLVNNLASEMPTADAAANKLRGQSKADMPVVKCMDLQKTAGDQITVDMVNIVSGKPVMGERVLEGKGDPMTFSSQSVFIDQTRKAISAGGKMTQQRTPNDLRKLATAQLYGYLSRWEDQTTLVHLAGARGSQTGLDWVVPLASDSEFADILVNPVKAPTYNRHFVASETSGTNALVQGGAQLGSVDSTDKLALEHIDLLRAVLDDMDTPLQPVMIPDDPAAADEPLYVMLVSPRQYAQILTSTSGQNIRAFQQQAWNRASYGSKHPLFRGEVGIWNGILVKKMTRTIRFNPSDSTQIITAANRYSATESAQTVNASLTAGYAVDRALLLGAQALAAVYGKNQRSGVTYDFSEKELDHGDKYEVAVASIQGKAKVRFSYDDGLGNQEPTAHGVIVVDSVVKL